MPVSAVMGKKAGLGSSHRCAQWGPANAPQAEEKSQPNSKSYHIHHAPCFFWQKGRHSSSLLDAEAFPSSPSSPHISNHGYRLFYFLSSGEEAAAQLPKQTLVPHSWPLAGSRGSSVSTIHCHGHPTEPPQEMPISRMSRTTGASPH